MYKYHEGIQIFVAICQRGMDHGNISSTAGTWRITFHSQSLCVIWYIAAVATTNNAENPKTEVSGVLFLLWNVYPLPIGKAKESIPDLCVHVRGRTDYSIMLWIYFVQDAHNPDVCGGRQNQHSTGVKKTQTMAVSFLPSHGLSLQLRWSISHEQTSSDPQSYLIALFVFMFYYFTASSFH